MHKLILFGKLIPTINTGCALMQRTLVGIGAMLCLSSIAFAAVPINDNELTNNFLKNDIIVSDVDYAQVPLKSTIIRYAEENFRFQPDENIRIEQVFIDPVKINSNTTDTLDSRTRKQMISDNNMLGFFSILNESYLSDNTITNYKLDGKKLSITYET